MLQFRVMKPLRLLFVADGRSPIALNWISYFVRAGHEVHLASPFACQPQLPLASLTYLPVAFSAAAEWAAPAGGVGSGSLRGRLIKRLAPPGLRTWLRQRLVPLSLPGAARRLAALARIIQPDLVHAMRIPYEGMLAAGADLPAPLLVSVWGNDFTLHAPSTAAMGRLTRRTLERAAALHTDCRRDQRLALEWGFDPARPACVLPGAGGVQADVFFPGQDWAGEGTVINPRGLRAYVRNDTFFQAAPLVLKRLPGTRFLCPTMQGQAEGWLRSLGIEAAVQLLPRLTRAEMAQAYRRAAVAVSITTHDGTPNTLLEALACGCFPIAGDLEALREWINPGENGLLVDPGDPQALAEAVVQALSDPALRSRARQHNLALVAERAEYGRVMAQAEAFYRQIA